ncbi:MAG: transposase, partial [Bacteroidetes bacterium]|nr:transposase [Bacteroidota bacterium]
LYKKLNEEFNFDFDPCPYNDNPKFDGLSIEWGSRSFCNPPYGREIKKWVKKGGRAKTIRDAYITGEKYKVAKVVCVKKPAMKEAWILAMSDENITATQAIRVYGKRWGIETSFRDIKDYKCGMGMKHMHTKSALRRDKLFLVSALAIAILTLLGAAGDAANLERTIKANTVKHRSYSFFRQGCIYYAMLPGMRNEWFKPLMRMFDKLLKEHGKLKNILGMKPQEPDGTFGDSTEDEGMEEEDDG